MSRLRSDWTALSALLLLTLAGCGHAAATPTVAPVLTPTTPPFFRGPLSVTVLAASGPRTLTRQISAITLHLRVHGLHFDARHMGGSALTNHGHIQVYLDHIPSDAHRQVDLKGVIANIASPDFSLGLPPQLVTSKRGQHRLFVAIARNDYLLYPVKPAIITVTFQ